MKSYATLVDAIEQMAQDTSNAIFKAPEIDFEVEQTLQEVSRAYPHILEVPFEIESRFGNSTSTSAGNLVDSAKTQFLSTDVGKVVYNDKNKKFAVILSFSSTSQVAISADIFTSGQAYYIYNKECEKVTQVFIGDLFDNDEIIRAEYPVNRLPQFGFRHWRSVTKVKGDRVAEIRFDFVPDDSDASQDENFTRVIFQIARTHALSQLTDLAGAVDNGAGYSAGDTLMHIDAMADETAEIGDEFHLVGHSQTYVLTAATTFSSNEGDVTFFPALEADIGDGVVITFVKSTLAPWLEDLVIRRTFARMIRYHASAFLEAIPFGGANVFGNYLRLGAAVWDETEKDLNKAAPRTRKLYSTGASGVGSIASGHGHGLIGH